MMTWIKFTLWLLGSYTIYYITLIGWDFFRSRREQTAQTVQELSFVEEETAAPISVDDIAPTGREPALFSSGGVSLKQLFNLAREESVEYIKAVSF